MKTTNEKKVVCPICQQPLNVKLAPEGFWVYCGNGPCPGQASNDGARGATVEQAVKNLAAEIDTEAESMEAEYPIWRAVTGKTISELEANLKSAASGTDERVQALLRIAQVIKLRSFV